MIQLDVKSRAPVYLQIKNQIIDLIVHDIFPPESKLPSVRQLAVDLGINPNTIQKAYQELESEGIIYIIGGKGCFVGQRDAAVRFVQQQSLAEIELALRKAYDSGVTRENLTSLFHQIYGGEAKC